MNRKVFLFFLCGILCLTFPLSAFADDEISDSGDPQNDLLQNITEDPSTSSTPIVVDITSLINQNKQLDDQDPDQVEVIEPVLIKVEQTRQTVTPSDANGFKAVLLDLIGDYETVVTDYTYQSSQGYMSHSIEIEQDYSWICSCCIFALLLYCTFRTIGGICARF